MVSHRSFAFSGVALAALLVVAPVAQARGATWQLPPWRRWLGPAGAGLGPWSELIPDKFHLPRRPAGVWPLAPERWPSQLDAAFPQVKKVLRAGLPFARDFGSALGRLGAEDGLGPLDWSPLLRRRAAPTAPGPRAPRRSFGGQAEGAAPGARCSDRQGGCGSMEWSPGGAQRASQGGDSGRGRARPSGGGGQAAEAAPRHLAPERQGGSASAPHTPSPASAAAPSAPYADSAVVVVDGGWEDDAEEGPPSGEVSVGFWVPRGEFREY